MNGDVRVEVPAARKYSGMASAAAVNIATHLGFPAGDTSDLRLAIEQAVVLLLDPDQSRGMMTFSYQGKAGILSVEAQVGREGNNPIPPSRIDQFEKEAGPLVDSWKVDPDKNHLWLQKTLKS